ncbi:MAG: hypothetical protein R3321_04540, partial [Nitrososphaeraceae archaeon]|nr:hypothetical protein [Nitrososphaeraceae archaeon]
INGQVLLSVEGREIFHEQVIQLEGFSKEIHIPLKKDWLPNIYVTAVSVSQGQAFFGEVELGISPEENYLTVNIEPSREKLQPGDEISYRVRVLNPEGGPAQAQLSLGVVDEKIYALKADRTNIKNFFCQNIF